MIRAPSGLLMNHPGMQAYLASKVDSVFGNSGWRQPAANPDNPNMQPAEVPSFAAGGMMSPQGTPVRPGAPMPGGQPMAPPQLGASAPPGMDNAQIDQEAKRFVQANPQVAQQIQAVIAHAMQTGDLTAEELNMAVQLAKTALANPASYPQVRQFAIQNGLGTEADLPQEMDKGLLFTLLIAGNSMKATPAATPSGDAMQGQKPSGVLPEYKDGGMTGDKPHLAKLHAREYVIPEDALIYHGKKHFDKLVEQAREPKDGSAQ